MSYPFAILQQFVWLKTKCDRKLLPNWPQIFPKRRQNKWCIQYLKSFYYLFLKIRKSVDFLSSPWIRTWSQLIDWTFVVQFLLAKVWISYPFAILQQHCFAWNIMWLETVAIWASNISEKTLKSMKYTLIEFVYYFCWKLGRSADFSFPPLSSYTIQTLSMTTRIFQLTGQYTCK